MTTRKPNDPAGGIEGLFGGLSNLLQSLGDLAEKGQQLKESGTLDLGKDGKTKAVYGFNVRFGIGDDGQKDFKVEPFGNVRADQTTGRTVVESTREPIIDVIEEADAILVIAEMPGVDANDVTLKAEGDILDLTATRGEHTYHKEILLPATIDPEGITTTGNHGVIEIRCPRTRGNQG